MNDEEKRIDDALFLLGKRVAEQRKNKGMSQLRLSFEAGVAKSYLSDLERGLRNPSVKVLVRIAYALDVALSDLFSNQTDCEKPLI